MYSGGTIATERTPMKLTNQQYAMVLAGLSLLHEAALSGRNLADMEHFYDCEPGTPDDINALCEMINCGEDDGQPGNPESYRVLVLSSSHITAADVSVLTREAFNADNGMVMGRDTGFFIKLFSDPSDTTMDINKDYSLALKSIVLWAKEKGYGMIELDADGPVMSDIFPTFDW